MMTVDEKRKKYSSIFVCSYCEKIKKKKDMAKDTRNRRGVHESMCKKCEKKYSLWKWWRKTRPETYGTMNFHDFVQSTKKCNSCREVKLLQFFGDMHVGEKIQKNAQCKRCVNLRSKIWRLEHKGDYSLSQFKRV